MQREIEYYEIPGGFMMPGPHGQTAEESVHGGTRASVYLVVNRGEVCLIDTGIGAADAQAIEDLEWGTPQLMEHERRLGTHFAFPQTVDEALEDGSTIPVGEITLEVLHTPGHSPGSISLYNPLTQSAYVGDLPFWINPARPSPIGNAADLQRSLRRVAKLDVKYLGWGHYQGIWGRNEVRRF